ncbi:MAG: tRNA (guanosine(37)-N1)-methyltransferase TrmD [Oligoflexia bacterium]|nr:tRNA (guanosine(37)-N1)-methyltransferase TrmD [Oligoflexia bacterium]
MEFFVLTLFPEMIEAAFKEGVVGQAFSSGVAKLETLQIRDFANDKHKTVDDHPYGGGAGMVMRVEPLYEAWSEAKKKALYRVKTILMSPSGIPLQQSILTGLVQEQKQSFILICGRYEGVDQRFVDECVDEEISLGDFVLSGGEIAALALIDSLVRLLPGVLGNSQSLSEESFQASLLEYPHYTRPEEVLGKKVPEVLLSGNHEKIAQWRKEAAKERTKERRLDLWKIYQAQEEKK